MGIHHQVWNIWYSQQRWGYVSTGGVCLLDLIWYGQHRSTKFRMHFWADKQLIFHKMLQASISPYPLHYCWWFRNPASQLRLIVYPIIYRVFTSQVFYRISSINNNRESLQQQNREKPALRSGKWGISKNLIGKWWCFWKVSIDTQLSEGHIIQNQLLFRNLKLSKAQLWVVGRVLFLPSWFSGKWLWTIKMNHWRGWDLTPNVGVARSKK